MAFNRNLFNGILAVIGGVLLHFTYGHFYTIGNLAPYIMSYIKLRVDPTVDTGSAVWMSAIGLAMQGVSMPLGGALLPKIGYRAVVIIGSVINSGSILLTYFTIQKGFVYVVITYAVTLGLGFGFSYAVIFSVASSWFPERRGLIVGFIVGGFGLGALVFTPIQTAYINPNNVMVNPISKLFEDPLLLDKVPSAFLMLGGSIACLQLLGILLLRQKPEPISKLKPGGDEPANKTELKKLIQSGDIITAESANHGDGKVSFGGATSHTSLAKLPDTEDQPNECDPEEINFPPLQTLRRHEFYLLWIVMFCNIIPITLITASFKLVGQLHISNDLFLSGVATASSLFNSGGRILWGAICDRFSFKIPLTVMLLLWATLLFTFPFIVAVHTCQKAIYAIWVCLLFLCLSGVFVLMPAAVGRIFGPVYLAVNYGMIFSAFSVGSVICAVISEQLSGKWTLLYAMCGGFCIFALFVLIWICDPLMSKRVRLCAPCTGVLQRLQPRVNPEAVISKEKREGEKENDDSSSESSSDEEEEENYEAGNKKGKRNKNEKGRRNKNDEEDEDNENKNEKGKRRRNKNDLQEVDNDDSSSDEEEEEEEEDEVENTKGKRNKNDEDEDNENTNEKGKRVATKGKSS